MVEVRVGLGVAAVFLSLCGEVLGHVAAWHPAMYCLNGTSGQDDQNTSEMCNPLYQLHTADWWFHHYDKCDEFPPAPGVFLELPAGGSFTVELTVNRAFTTLSYDGKMTGDFGNGQPQPDWPAVVPGQPPGCIVEPNIHTQNESMAAGTAFAISYVSDLTKVTQQNLVVFSVLYNTPWKRIATYSVPKLPACPSDGCICAWGWVPNGCGVPNMYMEGFRCKVTGDVGNAAVALAQPPVWCEDDQSKCVQGPKQMVYWNQLDGNNVVVEGFDMEGSNKSPSYNTKMGFSNGAQDDIFAEAGSAAVPTHGSSGNAGIRMFPFWTLCMWLTSFIPISIMC
ncbi:hypothetical protein BDN72DRAFT_288494 [Pluteus cervinus]|uniref:Uncharacterized protein n=1 Tax=Pluteus cervinus TaxID=181527 RepID=A0ACD3AE74_9AGAR|nr:hypothetical protein BDN72DRAFT_288494 [Pluteus cervinus]